MGHQSYSFKISEEERRWIWRHWHWWLLIIGLALRLALCLTVSKTAAFFGWDGTEYHAYAQSLLAGQGDEYPRVAYAIRPPFYPIFLVPFVAISSQIVWHIQLVQSVLGVISATILALVAGKLAGQKAGDWAFTISIVHPFLVNTVGYLMTENIFIPLLWGGVLFLMKSDSDSTRISNKDVTIAGLLLGLACLTRPPLQLFLVVAVCWIGWRAWKKQNIVSAIKRMALFTAVSSAALVPVLVWNWQKYREFTLSPHGWNVMYVYGNSSDYLQLYEAKTKQEYYKILDRMNVSISMEGAPALDSWLAETHRFRTNHPEDWFRLQWYKFRHFWTPWLNPLIFPRSIFVLSLFTVTPIFILGLIEIWKRRKSFDSFLVLLIGLIFVGYLVGGLLFHVQVRYRIPFVDVAFIVLTASFLGQLDFTRIFSLKPFKREAQAQAT
ncbi:MAG: glycosyltransferase family 39 protein [Blastocatellales bacterium]